MPDRLIFTIPLQPTVGHRFQPTGFPDLGAATFERPDGKGGWVNALLLESEQSMANHLEAAGWDRGADAPHPLLKGLPYVRVINANGKFLSSSRTEAHRLSSAFIREGVMAGSTQSGTDFFREQFDLRDDVPLSGRHIASSVFGLDPLCLLHGAFFADPKLPGQPKITRALTSFIEATNIRVAESGGVKKDDVRHKNEEGGGERHGHG